MARSAQALGILLLLPWSLRAATVHVAVVDSLSRGPVAGVRLQAQPLADGLRAASPSTAFTDTSGGALIALEPGLWSLHLHHETFRQIYRPLWVGTTDTAVTILVRSTLFRMPEHLVTASAEVTDIGVIALAPQEVRQCPAPGSDPLRLARVLPGVASGGDQAPSAYSVRGGSWDENLLYIEGVEIQASQLLRNGLAEILSPVNGDLVGAVHFHVGVLPARLGDRLSSALEVTYRQPDSLALSAVAGTVRQGGTVSARHGDVRWLVGARRADLSRLTSDLQTSGSFSPEYRDLQVVIAREKQLGGVTLFGLRSRSTFGLEPQHRELRYNCGMGPSKPPRGPCDQFTGSGAGVERFDDSLDILGAHLRQRVGGVQYRAAFHALWRDELEDTDQVFLADWIPRSQEVPIVAGWVRSRDVVDGHLRRQRQALSLSMTPAYGETWELGFGGRRTVVDGQLRALDSLWVDGVPVTAEGSEWSLARSPVDGFAYVRTSWLSAPWRMDAELRGVRFDGPDETLLMPRLRLSRRRGAWRLSMAGGLAAQPPLFKELLRAPSMPESQKGADFAFELERQTDRARWRSTVFYRRGWDRISYAIDDVEICYSGVNDSRTRAWGLETLLRGQVGRAFGMVTCSYLRSEEDLEGDGLGWGPSAADQRHTATAYLEDRMELRVGWMQASRFHIRVLYGSGFPYTPLIPVSDSEGRITGLIEGERHSRRDDAYTRFDIGLTQAFRIGRLEFEMREEVANLFDVFNAVGYRQFPTPSGTMALLPRGLGRRVYSAELSMRL